MKITSIIYICPECRKALSFIPTPELTLNVNNLICTEDGYHMKAILIDDKMIDKLLKGEIQDATS